MNIGEMEEQKERGKREKRRGMWADLLIIRRKLFTAQTKES